MKKTNRIGHRRGRLAWIGLLSLGLAWDTGCSRRDPLAGAPTQGSTVAAVVAGTEITTAALQAELQLRVSRIPGATNQPTLDEKLAALDQLIDQEALYAKAKAAGFDQSPEMQRSIRNLVLARFKDQQLPAGDPAVTEKEIQQHYLDHPERYLVPAAIRGAAILLAAPFAPSPQRLAELRQRAESIHAQVTAATNANVFATLAARCSDHQASRYHGGDLGWITAGDPGGDPGLIQALQALGAKGEVAPLIQTPRGFYIARLIDRRDAEQRPLASVSEAIRYQLTRQKSAQRERDFLAAAKSGLAIEIRRACVEALALPSPPSEPTFLSQSSRSASRPSP